MEGSIGGDATPQIGTGAISCLAKEEPVFRDFFRSDRIARFGGFILQGHGAPVPRFGECAMGSQN
jgi:hypothetical protein